MAKNSTLSRGSVCRRVCRQACQKDGVCRDGGRGARGGDRPECNYGEDCADCGRRALCTPAGTKMLLPYEALRHGMRRPLQLSQILFLVMGSHRFRARSVLVHQTWCLQQKASCLFFMDDHGGGDAGGGSAFDSSGRHKSRVRDERRRLQLADELDGLEEEDGDASRCGRPSPPVFPIPFLGRAYPSYQCQSCLESR